MTNFIATTLMPLLTNLQAFAFDFGGIFEVDLGDLIKNIGDFIQAGLWKFVGVDNILEAALGDTSLDTIKTALFLGNSSGAVYKDFWPAINSALNVIKPVGYGLITTFFILFLFDMAGKDQLTFDSLVKLGIQLIIVVAIAGNLNTIINAFLSLGDSLLNKISNVSGLGGGNGVSDGVTKSIVDDWAANTHGTAIFALIQAILLWVLHEIAVIGCYFAAISRALDIGWRIAFAPIGVANSFEGGSNSAGVKYLKSLAASILSGVLIYVVIALGFKISGGFLRAHMDGRVLASMAAMLATAGAAIGVSAKAKEIIQ